MGPPERARSSGGPAHASQAAARIDVLVHRYGKQEQADEGHHDDRDRKGEPPPDAGDHGSVLVRQKIIPPMVGVLMSVKPRTESVTSSPIDQFMLFMVVENTIGMT